MKKQDLYFESIDSTTCHPLEHFLHDAKIEALTEITLLKADPDNDNPDYIYCTHYGEVSERCECKKSVCSHYESKSGRGLCSNRGRLYSHGEEVIFKL
jgi:hypothetical protein